MNRDQVAGKAKNVAGKIQQKVGEATGSVSQQIKGVGKQVEGKIQEGAGDATEVVKKVDRQTRP